MDDATANRLAKPQSKQLQICDLQEGQFGVVVATIEQIHPTRTFTRKQGGEGTFTRVSLSDETGDIDLVLWGDELNKVSQQPQQRVTLRGLTVKPGFRGGVELHLGNGQIESIEADTVHLNGKILAVGPIVPLTRPPPHVKCQVTLGVQGQSVDVDLFDEAAKLAGQWVDCDVRVGPVSPHPFLEGRYVATIAHIQKQ